MIKKIFKINALKIAGLKIRIEKSRSYLGTIHIKKRKKSIVFILKTEKFQKRYVNLVKIKSEKEFSKSGNNFGKFEIKYSK